MLENASQGTILRTHDPPLFPVMRNETTILSAQGDGGVTVVFHVSNVARPIWRSQLFPRPRATDGFFLYLHDKDGSHCKTAKHSPGFYPQRLRIWFRFQVVTIRTGTCNLGNSPSTRLNHALRCPEACSMPNVRTQRRENLDDCAKPNAHRMNDHMRMALNPARTGENARKVRAHNAWRRSSIWLALLFLLGLSCLFSPTVLAADSPTNSVDMPHFIVQAYNVQSLTTLPTNVLQAITAHHSGTNVALDDIVEAAAEVQAALTAIGTNAVSVAFRQEDITGGVVTMYVFQGAEPQILVSGVRHYSLAERTAIASLAAATNNIPTNKFTVRAYAVQGNTLLSVPTLTSIFVKYTGTNITLTDLWKARTDLQMEYLTRGFSTVQVFVPPQSITNGIVQIHVVEGRLAGIEVVGNHFFSSNNIARELPSLHTNMILVEPVFQAELNRANANQDRQIYPRIKPGPEEGTSVLRARCEGQAAASRQGGFQ